MNRVIFYSPLPKTDHLARKKAVKFAVPQLPIRYFTEMTGIYSFYLRLFPGSGHRLLQLRFVISKKKQQSYNTHNKDDILVFCIISPPVHRSSPFINIPYQLPSFICIKLFPLPFLRKKKDFFILWSPAPPYTANFHRGSAVKMKS